MSYFSEVAIFGGELARPTVDGRWAVGDALHRAGGDDVRPTPVGGCRLQ